MIRTAIPLQELRNMNHEFVRSNRIRGADSGRPDPVFGTVFPEICPCHEKGGKHAPGIRLQRHPRAENSLTSIRGFVETLKAGAIEDPKIANKFLDIIEIESDRLSNLISDTLLLSEIESKKETRREPCDVNEVITEVVDLLQPKVKEHVRLIFHPDASVRPYSCNRDRLKQLLINLVDNGLKATEFGAVTVSCRSTASQLVLEVSDTGIGMEEGQLDRIFERF